MPTDDFAKLERRVKHVSEAAVRKKWRKLPSLSHTASREIISSAKEQSRGRRGKAKIDLATEDCVEEVANRLIERLPRVPFPPSTEELYFDHEANLHRLGTIEEQLSANIHSLNLLRAQIAKDEQRLKQDEAEVEHLESSLRSNEIYRREQGKTLHPLAQNIGVHRGTLDLLFLDTKMDKDEEPSIAQLFEDDELRQVLHQLRNHLDSMQSNTSGVRQIEEIIQHMASELDIYSFSQPDKDENAVASNKGAVTGT